MEQITFLTLTAAVQNHYISSPQQSSMSLQDHFSSIPCHKLLRRTRTCKELLFKPSVVVFALLPIGQKRNRSTQTALGMFLGSSPVSVMGETPAPRSALTNPTMGSSQAEVPHKHPGDFSPFPPMQATQEFRGLRQGLHSQGNTSYWTQNINVIIN